MFVNIFRRLFQAIHPTIQKTHMARRLQTLEQGTEINWATAEALAMGTLLYQGELTCKT